MEINVNNLGEEIIVNIAGRIDTTTSVEFENAMLPVTNNTDKVIIFDCTNLDYISSSGLRLFLTLRKKTQADHGKLVLRHLNADIYEVFRMTGFDNLFNFEA